VFRGKALSVLALLLTAGFVAFVLAGPPLVVRPVCQALLAVIVAGAVVVIVRKVYLARRPASRNQPPTS
jgi:hypothetical protein